MDPQHGVTNNGVTLADGMLADQNIHFQVLY